jgi:hypothetical protein
MAKVKVNSLFEGLSGQLGKTMVVRQMKDGSIILSAKPDFSRRIFSQGQLTHQLRVKQAAAYAKQASKTNPIYVQLAKGTNKTAYNMAFADALKPPVIHSLKKEGTRILVDVSDNVMVTRVLVTILDQEGKVLEKGEGIKGKGIKGKGDWWEYVSRAEGKVLIETWDLAGNKTTGEFPMPINH